MSAPAKQTEDIEAQPAKTGKADAVLGQAATPADAGAEQDKDEETPLLGPPVTKTMTGFFFRLKGIANKFHLPQPENVMDYETHDLASWNTYCYWVGTILQNSLLWLILLRLIVLAAVVSCILVVTQTTPKVIHVLHLEIVSATINVFVGLMLAFFMNSSVQRWINTVNGFLGLFDAIRNLSMQMHALGVDKDKRRQLTKYGLLSCEFLVLELHVRSQPPEIAEASIQNMVDGCDLEEWEVSTIRPVVSEHRAIAGQLWVWVASLIGRMAKDGEIPPMASPIYGRIMNLCQDAQEGIRQVRVSIIVQMPFIYVHTLALLVHSNNILGAIQFAITLTSRVCAILFLLGVHYHAIEYMSEDARVNSPNVMGNFAEICESFITHMVAPLIYQGFFQIGLTLAQPFDNTFGAGLSAIPTTKLIEQTKRDLTSSEAMIDGIDPERGWHPAKFNQ